MLRPHRTVGAILAGGASRRFGSSKAHAEWRGRSLIEWAIDAHRCWLEESCIVSNDEAGFGAHGLPVVPDVFTRRGPAGGIHAALRWAAARGARGVWCTPCDSPLVDRALLPALLARADGADAVLPGSDGPLGYEPLFGWYRTGVEKLFADAIADGPIAVHRIVESLTAVVVVDGPGGGAWHFANVNVPDDLAELEAEAAGGRIRMDPPACPDARVVGTADPVERPARTPVREGRG